MSHIRNNMINVNNEYNILSNILNPTRRAKNKNSNYSLILHGCMDKRIGMAIFRNFLILLDSCRSSTTVTDNLMSKIKCKKPSTIMWKTQGSDFITNEMSTV